ncbi:putative baseplate assembly protein [Streptomyces rectiverticillatus]|uniref:putative baseplate assembly protein n=1 Tax=Streptomyces rectiverticillatus TaxID=173860 RepID=UPI0015C3AEA4|nr:putative baseplate assembly protein [Streptomyces rectiverticillatus]QLE70514.1 putative baseplate assembly protein [Streptomyces rectiverticillatus]
MSLPTPEYDGRTRDQVVAAAVDAVHRKVGVWSGQDRADPGRGLIETCTDMVVALRDRINLAPDQRRLQVLSTLGVRPYQPSPAQTEVVFRLAAPPPEPVVVPAGLEVATRPVGEDEPVVFSTLTEAVLNPCVLVASGSFRERRTGGGALEGTLTGLGADAGKPVEPAAPAYAGPPLHLNLPYLEDFPASGDAMDGIGIGIGIGIGSGLGAAPGGPPAETDPYALMVLSVPVPNTRVTLDVRLGEAPVTTAGGGSRPARGRWEAWQGTHWTPCRIVTDSVTALGRPGQITLDLPSAHAPAQLLLHRRPDPGPGSGRDPGPGEEPDTPRRLRDVGLIRYRTDAGQALLTEVALNPVLSVPVPVVQARLVQDEVLGTASGTSGERLRFAHPPMSRSTDPLVVEATLGGRTERWTHVASLAGSGPGDRHFTLDPRTGEAVFAPLVAGARGPRQHGAALPAGAVVRARRYLSGGGARGNVPARTITVLRTPLPYISSVTNPAPAVGGTERESAAACATRLPLGSPVPERAVVPRDYEQLALAASAGMARIHHIRDLTDDALDPARNYVPWEPATTEVRFTLAPGMGEVRPGAQVTTEDGKTVFTTTAAAVRELPQPMGTAPLRLRPNATGAEEMFLAGSYTAESGFSGPFKEHGKLVLALVRIAKPHDPRNLTLWVAASRDGRQPDDRIAVSVFAPRRGRPWWDTASPCAYAAAPAEGITVTGGEKGGQGGQGTSLAAHPVPLADSARWLAAVERGELATTPQEALEAPGHDLPVDGAACWLAVQILDPKGTDDTTYTVHADSGTTKDVPAVQYATHLAGHKEAVSTGQPGQVLPVLEAPVYGDLPVIRVGADDWTTVLSFTDSQPDDKHVVVNASTGQVHFGPWIGNRQYGKVPLKGTKITAGSSYKVTLGTAANDIAQGGVNRVKDPLDGVLGVVSTSPTHGGKNGYTDTSGGSTQAGVRLMVVPFVTADERGWFPFHMLTPGRDAADTLRRSLRARQPEGVPVWLEQPGYRGIRVDARIVPADYRTASERAALGAAAERALYRYFSPVGGGPDRTGWPLGRPVHVGEAFRILEQVPGVARVATATLTPVDPRSGVAEEPVDLVGCGPGETVYSVEHRITVAEVPS